MVAAKIGLCGILAVLVVGTAITVFDLAYLLGISQQFYNLLFVFGIMPASVWASWSLLVKICNAN